MKHLAILVSATVLFSGINAQTCVGVFNIRLMDAKTEKPLKGEAKKNIWYVHTTPEGEFYDHTQSVLPLDSILKNPNGYTIHHNEKGYTLFQGQEASAISFANLCGLYLVQLEIIVEKDTMRLGIYNIPAHQSFQLDTLLFKPGNYFIDLQSSNRLIELTFQENTGLFLVPTWFIEAFAKKEEKD